MAEWKLHYIKNYKADKHITDTSVWNCFRSNWWKELFLSMADRVFWPHREALYVISLNIGIYVCVCVSWLLIVHLLSNWHFLPYCINVVFTIDYAFDMPNLKIGCPALADLDIAEEHFRICRTQAADIQTDFQMMWLLTDKHWISLQLHY